jgi:hypothetical protein
MVRVAGFVGAHADRLPALEPGVVVSRHTWVDVYRNLTPDRGAMGVSRRSAGALAITGALVVAAAVLLAGGPLLRDSPSRTQRASVSARPSVTRVDVLRNALAEYPPSTEVITIGPGAGRSRAPARSLVFS